MDTATSSAPPLDAVNVSSHHRRDDSPQSPERLPIAIVAHRRIGKATGSPMRRSPRLSGLPPAYPPIEPHNTQDSSGDESESINGVALHLSRDEILENDDLPPDEPSTILANRIIRAHDNPSPPPQELTHAGINHVPGKDGQFPPPGLSVPPSPFRPINLLEQLSQFSPPFYLPHGLRTPTLVAQPDTSEPGIILPRSFISPESFSPSVTPFPMERIPHEDLASADTKPSLSVPYAVDDLPPRSSEHPITITGSLKSKDLSPPPTQTVDSLSGPTVPSASDDDPRSLRSEQQQSVSRSSHLLLNSKALSPPLANRGDKVSSDTDIVSPGEQANDGEGALSMDNDSQPLIKGEQESKGKPTCTTEVDVNPLQRLDSLSPLSANVFAERSLHPESTPLTEQTNPSVESFRVKRPSASPPRTPTLSITHPDFSRTSVQRPVIAPTPVRADSSWKLNSLVKFSHEGNDIYRTPARRVPIETVLARGTSSFQKTARPSTGPAQSRPGSFLAIRTPVFTRPALDDPSRSPAKRIPIADSVASPTRGQQAQSFPTRVSLSDRSASVELRPRGTVLARSQSVEPCAPTSKFNDYAKVKESVFPIALVPQMAAAKLPFPLVSGKRSNSDFPPPIPEEQESAETRNPETDATLGRSAQGNAVSQLRQPSTSSRIPRIGNKPYARPPKAEKATTNVTTSRTIHTPRASAFQLTSKNDGAGNSNAEGSSIQLSNDQHLVGSLKRKRDTEATAPPNSHPVVIRQVVPGILNKKYAPKLAKVPSQVLAPLESNPSKVPQQLKFRKVVDGMLSARYAPAKANCAQTEPLDSISLPPSPLSELSSSSNEGSSDEKPPPTPHPLVRSKSERSDTPRADDTSVVGPNTHEHSLHQDVDRFSSRPRRTSRARKPAQQQYILDVFNGNAPTRPPPARRKPQSHMEGECFTGMSATALKVLTTSNTTKNQQTVAVLATEVIRKEGQRPESPAVKARTILQKQRDERDTRRRERAQRRAQMNEEGLGDKDTEGQAELDGGVSLDACADHDKHDSAVSQKHLRWPGDEEDYETPERPEHIEPLRLEGVDRNVKTMKQVKWHRGLSTAVYSDEVGLKPKSLPKNIVVRGCLAPTSKNLPLDSLGNLLDVENRLFPELVTEHIVVKRYLYDNDIEPEPIPAKMTRSKSKKSRS